VTYITGRSGIGKSTLFKILSGQLKQDSGDISISDGINGKTAIKPEYIPHISQTPFMFNGTIAENITLLDESDIEYDKLDMAVKRAGINDFIESLPNKYSYIVHDKGNNLSGGQKTRLALSRLFYNPTPIILFDEVYASVDNIVIEELEKSIKELCDSNACVLFISHRKEWIPKDAIVLNIENFVFVN